MSSEAGRQAAAWPGRRRSGRDRRAGTMLALAALLAAIAFAAAACGSTAPTPAYTEVPIGPTPWPSGTTGQYGLHIDPSLLGRLPQTVDANPIIEDAESESLAMDNADLANTFDNYAAAGIGALGEDNWLFMAIGHFKPDVQSPDVYAGVYQAWVTDYATGACSQANAVTATTQETINGWIVDEATCGGGPKVYTLSLGDNDVLSMFGAGPLDLGRLLITALY